MKGGVGLGDAVGDGVFAAAIAVVNAFGDVRDAHGRIIAGARTPSGEFIDSTRVMRGGETATDFSFVPSYERRNTTLAVVAVSVPLAKSQLAQLATAATAAFYRRITPCGTSFDGDVLFAVSPVTPLTDGATRDIPLARIEAVAVAALEDAIQRGVTTARSRDGFKGLADLTENTVA
jgi:L-aminopeptidase/D-esterase-like protein